MLVNFKSACTPFGYILRTSITYYSIKMNTNNRLFEKAFSILLLVNCTQCVHDETAGITISCDDNAIYVHLVFDSSFNGSVYAKDFDYIPLCRFSTTKELPNEVFLILNHLTCGNVLKEIPGFRPSTMNTIVIQYSQLIPSEYDQTKIVYCELTKPIDESVGIMYLTIKPEDHNTSSRADFVLNLMLGSAFFRESLAMEQNVNDSLLMVFTAKDRSFTDVIIGDCISLNDDLNKLEINFQILQHHCNEFSSIVNAFTVMNNNVTEKLTAYMEIKDEQLPYISCKVRICKKICKQLCVSTEDLSDLSSEEVEHQIDKRVTQRIKRSVVETDFTTNWPTQFREFNPNPFKNRESVRKSMKDIISRFMRNRRGRASEFGKRIFDDPLTSSTVIIEDKTSISDVVDPIESSTVIDNVETRTLDEFPALNFHSSTKKDFAVTDLYDKDISENIQNFTISTIPSAIEDEEQNQTDAVEFSDNSDGFKNISTEQTLLQNETLVEHVNENCVPKLRFYIVTTTLGIVVFLLSLSTCGMYLHLRKEEKRHVADNFLLYNFY